LLIRILLVEDDTLQAAYTRQILEAQRFYVDVASGGLDAVRKILAGWFDIVLMDHHIPDFDGVAVGRVVVDLIRSEGRPRLLALSAAPDAIRAREGGTGSVFDAIIPKPWDPQGLIAAIRRTHRTLPPSTRRAEAVHPGRPVRHGPTTPETPQAAKVLVIDDDGQLRNLVCLAATAAGYRVEQSTSGLEALRMLVRETFDVVVMDYQMPHVDGLATSRLIFSLLPPAERPRLVALTSAPERLATEEAGRPSLFDAVVGKSEGMKALLAAVARCVEYRTLRRREAPTDVVRLDSILAMAINAPQAGSTPAAIAR
jgi:DNA-binding response OmpR family regulator